MSLHHKVYGTLKWKKSDEYCATKLGISLEEYKKIKHKVLESPPPKITHKIIEFKEDVEKGTAEIKGISSTEPRSAEEIIQLLKIDTNKWKLSSYWNKETHSGWYVSAMVTQKKQEPVDYISKVIENFKPKYQEITTIHTNDKYETPSVAVLSIQDLHFGKEGNFTIIEDFKNAVRNLVMRAYASHKLEKTIYVIGGDLLNMDTFSGTTTSGTPVDNEQRAQDAYNEAFDALYWSVNYIKQFCNELEVVYLPGNHDRLSSYHIAHALSKCFQEDRNIKFNVEYSERKVVVYGDNFFAFEHGDVTKKLTPLVYATEFPKQWGSTTYRTCYTGHFHNKKVTEFVTDNEVHGFSIKHLPSLSRSDYWHYHNKFTGSKRQAILEVHDPKKGKISEFTHNS